MPAISITRLANQAHESVSGIRDDTSSRGVDLAGAVVTATYADGSSETVTWVALDPYTNGGATGADFDMFFGYEIHQLTVSETKLLTTLEMDLTGASSVFDTTLTMEDDPTGDNTPTSKNGYPFLVGPAYESLTGSISATYSGIINLVGRPADGDLFTTMLIDFSALTAGGIQGLIEWNSDIDTMRYAGDLIPESALGVSLISGSVISEFSTISAALAAAGGGDMITVGTNYAAGPETVSTALDGLTFNLPAGVSPTINLTKGSAQDINLQGLGTPTVNGNAFGSTVDGSDGGYTFVGSAGNDAVDGGTDDDMLEGGAGADTLEGGEGTDAVIYTTSDAAVTINLNNGAALGGHADGDVLSLFENITGSAHADRLTGDAMANVLNGADGGDLLAGLAGNDMLIGDMGIDSLAGGDGDDTLLGGDDDDRLFGNNDNDSIDGGAGDDYTNGGAGNDTINGGADDDNVLVGSSGEDLISGDGGSDGLNGSFGDDTLMGGTGADRLYGADGNDSLIGGADADVMGGQADADVLIGGTGADGLNGGGGNDDLDGGDDEDRLYGGTGDDTLNGGADDDLLVGQSGLDTFVFDADWGHDRIAQYGNIASGVPRADEVIDLSSLGITFGDLTIEATASFGTLIYVTADGSADNTIEVLFRSTSEVTSGDFFFG